MLLFHFGIDIKYDFKEMGFLYGEEAFGPSPELRLLKDIRPSLRDPDCEGPDIVYSIAMDVGQKIDRDDLIRRNLLYGAVIYNRGRLGQEPIRSQGHIHKVSESCGCSTPEVYEIHSGRAVIYMQERAEDDPGRCFAVTAEPGQVVVVPPGWAHMTVSADPAQPLAFGAWCVRDYGFEYGGTRAHGGLAWFPRLAEDNSIAWEHNPRYQNSPLREKSPRRYGDLGLDHSDPIYRLYQQDRDRFRFVTEPESVRGVWVDFIP